MRIILNIALLFSILFFPWFVTVVAALLCVFIQKKFYEVVGWGLLYDVLYGTTSVGNFGFNFFFMLGSLMFLFGAEYIKRKTRFY
ncbi:MAG: hypothetical protein Q8R36_03310 [bacterium]|nr:hypothetical protein [bacterium]